MCLPQTLQVPCLWLRKPNCVHVFCNNHEFFSLIQVCQCFSMEMAELHVVPVKISDNSSSMSLNQSSYETIMGSPIARTDQHDTSLGSPPMSPSSSSGELFSHHREYVCDVSGCNQVASVFFFIVCFMSCLSWLVHRLHVALFECNRPLETQTAYASRHLQWWISHHSSFSSTT